MSFVRVYENREITLKKRGSSANQDYNLEFKFGPVVVSLCLNSRHDGWTGTDLMVWNSESGEDIWSKEGCSAEDVAKVLQMAQEIALRCPKKAPSHEIHCWDCGDVGCKFC